MKNVAIFASGGGSNAEKIAQYFKDSNEININLILSNKKEAKVLERAARLNIPHNSFTKSEFLDRDFFLNFLNQHNIELIVLAGFLWLIPKYLIEAFPNKIINIHPSLLPKYGGKGMYGIRVHEAVAANKEQESGITIHYVNEAYDEGNIIFQKSCRIELTDSPEQIAKKVLTLEHEHYPKVIEKLLSGK